MKKNKSFFLMIILGLYQSIYPINFKFHLKPDNMTDYKWGVTRAREETERYMKIIIQKLKIDTQYWNKQVDEYRSLYKQEVAEELKEIKKSPMTNKIRNAIQYIATHPKMKHILGILGTKEENNIIKIYIKDKSLIQVINTPKIDTSTFGRTIILNEAESAFTSQDVLISNITHELGHITYNHCLFRELIEQLYEKHGKKARYRKKNFKKDFSNLMKIQEEEADIFSVFDDVIEGKKAALSFKDSDILELYPEITNIVEINMVDEEAYQEDDDECDEHPSCEQRFNNLMYLSNQMEQTLTDQNKLTIDMLVDLINIAIEIEEYIKAHYYISHIKHISTHLKKKIANLRMYVNAHIQLQNNNHTEAQKLFSQLANQNHNSNIKVKSEFMMGLFNLNSTYQRNKGITSLQHLLHQNQCIRTKIKAHRILAKIPKIEKKQSPMQSNSFLSNLTLCRLRDLQKLITL